MSFKRVSDKKSYLNENDPFESDPEIPPNNVAAPDLLQNDRRQTALLQHRLERLSSQASSPILLKTNRRWLAFFRFQHFQERFSRQRHFTVLLDDCGRSNSGFDELPISLFRQTPERVNRNKSMKVANLKTILFSIKKVEYYYYS